MRFPGPNQYPAPNSYPNGVWPPGGGVGDATGTLCDVYAVAVPQEAVGVGVAALAAQVAVGTLSTVAGVQGYGSDVLAPAGSGVTVPATDADVGVPELETGVSPMADFRVVSVPALETDVAPVPLTSVVSVPTLASAAAPVPKTTAAVPVADTTGVTVPAFVTDAVEVEEETEVTC